MASEPSGVATVAPRWQGVVDDALVVALVAVVFGASLRFGFVEWDDYDYLLRNPLIQHPLANGLVGLLATPEMGYPQPLTVLSQHLDARLGGGAAWVFHFTNVALHALCALCVRRVARALGVARGAALVSALVFACHPIVVEPVCWATGRKDLLAGLFVLAGLRAYLALVADSARRRACSAAALACAAVLACAAKPSGAVLPALVLAHVVVFRPALGRAARGALAFAGVVAVGVTVVAYVTQAHHAALTAPRTLGAAGRYVTQHLALQLRNYALPDRLLPKYLEGLPVAAGTRWGLAGLAVTAALGGALVALHRRGARRALFALAFFLVAFAPSSGLVGLARGPADVYLYVPSVGLALLVGLGFEALAARWRVAGGVGAAGLVATLALLAYVQSAIWHDSVSLWRALRDGYPDVRYPWTLYARALSRAGRVREAVAVAEAGLRRFPYPPPGNPEALTALGLGCIAAGDAACATRWYGEAVRYYPPTAGRALRLLAAAAVYDDREYAREVAASHDVTARALATLAATPDDARPAALDAFFARELAADAVPARFLTALARDPALGDVARELLARYRAARPLAP